jgi:predicted nucleic acid-binding protein
VGSSSEGLAERLHDLLTFLNDVQVLEVTSDVARRFGEIRAGLLDHGLPARDMDLLIAATALLHGLTLVTHNTSDYATFRASVRLTGWSRETRRRRSAYAAVASHRG